MNIATPADHAATSHARKLIFRAENAFAAVPLGVATTSCGAISVATATGMAVALAISPSFGTAAVGNRISLGRGVAAGGGSAAGADCTSVGWGHTASGTLTRPGVRHFTNTMSHKRYRQWALAFRKP